MIESSQQEEMKSTLYFYCGHEEAPKEKHIPCIERALAHLKVYNLLIILHLNKIQKVINQTFFAIKNSFFDRDL